MVNAIQTETLGQYAYQAIQKHFKKSIKYKKHVLNDVDLEPIHQMRVGLRRLRTAVDVFAAAVELPQRLQANQLKKIAGRLGTVRDLDVLLAKLETHYLPHLKGQEQDLLKGLIQQFQRQRRKKFGRVEKMLEGGNYRQFKRDFQSWLDQPSYGAIASFPIQDVIPDLLLPLLSHLLLHPAWLADQHLAEGQSNGAQVASDAAINQWLDQHGTIFHDLRKQIKRVRYQAEFFTDFYDSPYQEWLDELRASQDCLGNLQDDWVLQQLLEDEVGSDWAETMPDLAHQLSEERVALWKEFQPTQQRYLSPVYRDRLRKLVLTPKPQRPSCKPPAQGAQPINGAQAIDQTL